MGERDAALHLPPRYTPGQLPHALDDLREPGGRERMAPRLETAGRIDRETAFERSLAVERGRSRFSRRKESDVLERGELERVGGVVDLGDVDTRRDDPR